jgi:D-beta-D-heptose 7-phosphate kinase/D-beta-D-heptose 1-phosphate adenosyltransferase
MTRARRQALIAGFAGKRVAVLGDVILDVYLWGKAQRISPEAPVPVVEMERRTETLGGAANVMRNLAALGAEVAAFSLTGRDAAGQRLRRLLDRQGIRTADLISTPGRTTTEKQRVFAGNQQVCRIDYETCEDVPGELRAQLVARLAAAIRAGEVDAVIIEDYAKGLLDRAMVTAVVEAAAKAGLPTGLDPHPGHPLQVKGLTLMTPNRAEAFGLAGLYPHAPVDPPDQDEGLRRVAAKLMAQWGPRHLLVTLGAQGMALFGPRRACHHVPTRAREVFDVSGAGDTVIATFMMALLAGAVGSEAADIANHAAGIVVGKLGTAVATTDELLASFAQD